MKHFLRIFGMIALATSIPLAALSQTKANVIRPGEPWFDDRGQLIQAHGGGILQFDGVYYWFGEEYVRTNDPQKDPQKRYVACYSSSDLIHWKFRNQVVVLSDPEHLGEDWILERPKVFYNPKTGKYVLYAHLDSRKYDVARVAVFISDKVDGNYKYLKSFRPLDQESRDIGQFIDEDGSAYLIFESRPTKGFFIAKLSDDYLSVAKQVAFIREPLEGGAIVHIKDRYFVIGSHMTSWEPNPNVYASARSLAGPWSEMKNIAPPETNTYNSQSSMLIKVVGSKATSVIYIGDRWNPNDLWNSRYICMPLEVDADRLSLPMPRNWTINLRSGVSTMMP